MTIPSDLCFRVFDDGERSLGVFMRVLEGQLVLLEKDALNAWKQLINGGEINREFPGADMFESLGLVTTGKRMSCQAKNAIKVQGLTKADVSVLNYFAFRNRLPLAGHLELTQHCNLRCRHCYCVNHEGGEALSTEDWFHIIDDLASNGAMFIVLTGGELFIRKDIMKILQKLHDSRFVLRINTNGTFIDEQVVKELTRFGNIFRIHVSIYGDTPEIHDHITRVPGSFSKTIRAIKMLKDAAFKLRINCSVMSSNIHAFKNVYTQIAKPMGIPIHFDPSIFPMDDNSGNNLGEQLSAEGIAAVRRYKQQIGVSSDQDVQGKHQLCRAANAFFSVTSRGDVYPCLKMKRIYDKPIGNLMMADFKTIWHSATIKSIRESLERTLSDCDLCDVVI